MLEQRTGRKKLESQIPTLPLDITLYEACLPLIKK